MGVFFAGTDYGLQGATKPKLIVSAARKPFKPAVDMEGFYVFVSRVRRFANLRVLELPSRHTCFYKHCNCPYKSEARLDNLLELRHDPELQVWNEGFGANGGLVDRAGASDGRSGGSATCGGEAKGGCGGETQGAIGSGGQTEASNEAHGGSHHWHLAQV